MYLFVGSCFLNLVVPMMWAQQQRSLFQQYGTASVDGVAVSPDAAVAALSTTLGYSNHVVGKQKDAAEFMDHLLVALGDRALDILNLEIHTNKTCTCKSHTSHNTETMRVLPVGVPCTSVNAALADMTNGTEILTDFRCNDCFREGACRHCMDMVQTMFTSAQACESGSGCASDGGHICDDCIGKALSDVGSHDSMHCPLKGGAEDKKVVSSAGEMIVVHLKRIEHAGWRGVSKVGDTIPFGLQLRVTTKDGEVLNYQLRSVITHHGDTADSGHYTAKVRTATDGWVHIDDKDVTSVSVPNVLRSQAYICCTRKKKPAETSAQPVRCMALPRPAAMPLPSRRPFQTTLRAHVDFTKCCFRDDELQVGATETSVPIASGTVSSKARKQSMHQGSTGTGGCNERFTSTASPAAPMVAL